MGLRGIVRFTGHGRRMRAMGYENADDEPSTTINHSARVQNEFRHPNQQSSIPCQTNEIPLTSWLLSENYYYSECWKKDEESAGGSERRCRELEKQRWWWLALIRVFVASDYKWNVLCSSMYWEWEDYAQVDPGKTLLLCSVATGGEKDQVHIVG